jgi:hypothetical protein
MLGLAKGPICQKKKEARLKQKKEIYYITWGIL